MSIFSLWLNRQLEREKLNYSGLASLIGVRPNTARAWALGESEPSPENCQKIARLFHIDLADIYRLLGWLPEEKEELTEARKRIIHKILDLDEDDLSVAEAIVDSLEERREESRE